MDKAQQHIELLAQHCRVCGERLGKAKARRSTYEVALFAEQLHHTFGISTSSDVLEVHPTHFCHPCNNVMGRRVKADEEGVVFRSAVCVYEWEAHTLQSQCKV